VKYPGHLFLEEMILQPRGEWDVKNDVWLFVRVVSGEASWIDDRSSFLLKPGEVLLVAPTRRGTLRASQLSVLTTVYFQFRPELLGGFLTVHERARAERAAGARGLSRVFGARDEVAQEFKAICGLASDLNGPITRSRVLQLALTVLVESSAAPPARDAAFLPASKRAEVLLRKVSEAELLDYSADDLAARCGCSVRHMNKLLRDIFGVSLRAKQREIRLIKAQQLLAETNMRVGEVARACGFGEQTLFSMEFKRRFGVTPTAWRETSGVEAMRNGHSGGGSLAAS